MARYLVNEGFKDPAAVLIGSTLEAHLIELCKKLSIEVEKVNSKGETIIKSASVINSDLKNAEAYSSAIQKQIIAWQGIRNFAAHGDYNQYSIEETIK